LVAALRLPRGDRILLRLARATGRQQPQQPAGDTVAGAQSLLLAGHGRVGDLVLLTAVTYEVPLIRDPFPMRGHRPTSPCVCDVHTVAPGHVPWWPRPDLKLFNVMVHVLAETNRHLGHADILREKLD